MAESTWGGEWTRIKLEILKKYLRFFATALSKKRFKLVYIDGFAGYGDIPTDVEISLEGSVKIALECEGFNEYLFIERDPMKCEILRRLKENYPDKKITIRMNDCNELLSQLPDIDFKGQKLRGVIFLDPYGMSVEWATLKSIQKTEALDVLYLFPLSALVRNLRKDGMISKATQSTITGILGDSEWYDEIYSRVAGLFGEEISRVGIEAIKRIVIQRLKTVFPAVSDKSRILRNSKSSPMFLLCFAVSNPSPAVKELAIKVADSILSEKGP